MDGKLVVVKHAKRTTRFHEFLLSNAFALISILLCHPASPPDVSRIVQNEGVEMRQMLAEKGIPTPKLISISCDCLVEEYISGGDLYRSMAQENTNFGVLAFEAGMLTGRLHSAGLVFNDNKAQNYLVANDPRLLRTDLAFIKKTHALFSKSMDIGSFLASVIGLEHYPDIERHFFDGYKQETGSGLPYLSIVIRNILSLGFSSDLQVAAKNMMRGSQSFLSV